MSKLRPRYTDNLFLLRSEVISPNNCFTVVVSDMTINNLNLIVEEMLPDLVEVCPE